MAYTPTTWTTGDTITASSLNKIEQGIVNAGGYDLILLADGTVRGLGSLTTSDVSVVQGNILDCEEKIDNGEPVNAILVLKGAWSYKPSLANTRYTARYFTLTSWDAPYCLILFNTTWANASQSTNMYINIQYDYESGDITGISAQGSRNV